LSGAVYRGKYRNESVAIKEFLTQSQAEAFGDDDGQAAQTVYREVKRERERRSEKEERGRRKE
jgi:hypothetical protein